jgi:hypothetical protein
MKNFIFLFVLSLITYQNYCQERVNPQLNLSRVDSLNSKEAVKKYLVELDSNFTNFYLKDINNLTTIPGQPSKDGIMKIIAAKLGTTNYYKTDFDNNNYTDLLVIGGWERSYVGRNDSGEEYGYSYYVIMNYGKNKAKVIPMCNDHTSFIIPEVKHSMKETYLVIHSPDSINEDKPVIADKISTKLVYKSYGFCEFNQNPIDDQIEKIDFATTACFGRCPVFQITINRNQSAIFIARYYNFSNEESNFNEEEGFFRGIINDADYKQLMTLVNYIDFKRLSNNYAVTWTDDTEGVIRITYKDGQVKEISDYGMAGSHSLQTLYRALSDFRFSQKWEKGTEPQNVRLPISKKYKE